MTAGIPWKEVQRADVALLDLVHRGHNGQVTLHRMAGGDNFQDVASLPASELRQQWLPGLVNALDDDGFFSVNGMARSGRGRSMVYGVNAPRPSRRGSNLKYLCACFADLDIRGGRDAFDLAVGRVMRLQSERVIPPASVVMFSGRGMWLFWLLDNGEGKPVRSSEDGYGTGVRTSKNATWLACQNRLAELLDELAPDRGAMRDQVRVSRVPGTVNTKSGERATYWVPFDENGQPFTYGIRELASRLKVRSLAERSERFDRPAYQRPAGVPACPVKRKGWVTRWVKVVNAVWGLSELRGGLGEGHRHRAVLIVAQALKTLGFDPGEVYDRLHRLASRFKQTPTAFTASEVNASIRNAQTCRGEQFAGGLKYQTVIDWLEMTPAECELLDFHPPKPAEPKGRKAATTRRRGKLRAILNEKCITGRPRPSLTELVRLLAERGEKASRETVRRDLDALRAADQVPDGWLF